MKSNPAPLLLVPGFALFGFVVAQWNGLIWALAGWLALIAIGTLAHVLRRSSERPPGGGRRVPGLALNRLQPARAYGFTRTSFEAQPRH